ncbi:YrhC family protein [Bacillus massilioanorexius]|uniref:YrhC family protein n=1 Tax=Bacillus TaxID=1386 RepID=UPI000379103E|nr:YrhC family protein [Bacillus massilioanorexius]
MKLAKKYREKMVDYKRFALLLLCVSTFSYIGTLISLSKQTANQNIMITLTLITLIASIVFFRFSSIYKQKAIHADSHIEQ